MIRFVPPIRAEHIPTGFPVVMLSMNENGDVYFVDTEGFLHVASHGAFRVQWRYMNERWRDVDELGNILDAREEQEGDFDG